jgi:hypothetical protein
MVVAEEDKEEEATEGVLVAEGEEMAPIPGPTQATALIPTS